MLEKNWKKTNQKRKREVMSGNSSSDVVMPLKLRKKTTKVKYQASDGESDRSRDDDDDGTKNTSPKKLLQPAR